MGNKQTSKKFNEYFKKMAVDLYRSGSSVQDISSENEVTLYKCIKKLSHMDLEEETSVAPDNFSKLEHGK